METDLIEAGTPPNPHGPNAGASISLVLPAKDEQEGLGQAITEVDRALRRITDDYEIIVVDDGSRDDTFAVAQNAAKAYAHVKVVRHETNQGYGAAIRTGFALATKQLVAFTDSDCQFDLRELDRFVFLAKDYDVVCGYRIDRQDTWLRCMYSKGYNALVRTLLGTGLRDIDCAMKLFRRSAVEKTKISTNGFLVNSELITTARQNDLSIVEVGVTHRPRTQGTSTVSAAHIPTVMASLLRFWWNHVMFAPDAVGTTETIRKPTVWRQRATAMLVAGIAILMLCTNLGTPLIDRDETRYAEIPREMIASGNWIVPQLNFKPYFDKPPLFYWFCAESYQLFGVSEWSARIVPASSALLVLLATFLFGRRIVGQRAALLGAFVLSLSVGFVFCSRFLIIDMVLTLFVTMSLFMAYEAVRGERFRWRWWMIASAACGLGILTKGPVAGVLLLPPVVTFVWLRGNPNGPRLRHWLVLMVVASIVVAPWAISIVSQEPRFAYEFLVRHNLSRFAGAYHQEPFWFFVPVLLIGGHPWTFLLLPFLSFFFSRRVAIRNRRPIGLGYLALWGAWCIFFFSLSKCKLPAYILPAAPAFALLMGHYLDQALFQNSQDRIFRWAKSLSPWLAAASTCVGAIGLSACAYVLRLASAAESMSVAFVFCMGLVALAVAWRRTASVQVAWGLCTALSALLVVQITQTWIPSRARQQAILVPGSTVTQNLRTTHPPIATFANEWSGIPFYLERNDIPSFRRDQIAELSAFVAANHDAIVIFDPSEDWDCVSRAMGDKMMMSRIDERGEASIVAVRTLAPGIRTASRPDKTQ